MAKDSGQFDPTQLEAHAYNSILFSGTSFKKEVKKLAKAPEYFKKFMKHHKFANSESKIYYTVTNIPDALANDKEFTDMCSALVTGYITCKTTGKYMHGNKRTMDIVQAAWKILDEDNRTKVINTIIKCIPSMYTYVKRRALEVVCDHVKDEQTARNIFVGNYTVLGKEQIDKLLMLIPNAQNDKDIANKLKKSAYFTVAFENIDFDTDHAKKIELIKTLISKPSLLKKLDRKLIITLDDLKALPPGMRFDLLNGMFFNLFSRFISSKQIQMMMLKGKTISPDNIRWILAALTNIFAHDMWLQNVSLGEIGEEDIKSLLFSKAINSNDAVSKWFDNYKEYLKVKTVLSPMLSQLSKLF